MNNKLKDNYKYLRIKSLHRFFLAHPFLDNGSMLYIYCNTIILTCIQLEFLIVCVCVCVCVCVYDTVSIDPLGLN